jgi:hypothetical protein
VPSRGYAVLTVSPSALAPYFVWRGNSLSLSGGSAVRFLAANSKRVGLLVQGLGANVNLSWTANQVGTAVYLIQQNAAPLALKFADFGGLIGGEWYASGGIGSTIVYTEIIFDPPSE